MTLNDFPFMGITGLVFYAFDIAQTRVHPAIAVDGRTGEPVSRWTVGTKIEIEGSLLG